MHEANTCSQVEWCLKGKDDRYLFGMHSFHSILQTAKILFHFMDYLRVFVWPYIYIYYKLLVYYSILYN